MAELRLCSIEGCDNLLKARGLCNKHYKRKQVYGDPNVPVHRKAKDGEPMAFLMNDAIRCQSDDCLTWPFGTLKNGYGSIRVGGRARLAHRLVCMEVHGAPPSPKHEVAHSCGKGHLGCVNPKHLRWATQSENMQDRVIHGTSNRGERKKNSTLKEADVRQIRRLRGQMTEPQIADIFGTSRGAVQAIFRKLSWAWLD
jgi:hypothetical protein